MKTNFRAYGCRVLDTKTRVWYECRSSAAARKLAAELNQGGV